ncbi:MAG: hypothetical protein KGZ38_03720 [Erysipelothrix sp.]|nr:hypothetical protein [Erysipelothrix sp.]
MQLKDKIINDINKLDPRVLPMLYDYIKLLRNTDTEKKVGRQAEVISHKDIQKLLARSKVNWADDLSLEREDRV